MRRNLAFFIHDCCFGIGQGNVTIQTINSLDYSKVKKITIYCFKSEPLETFKHPELITIKKLPFGIIRPYLFRDIWFHLLSSIIIFLKKYDLTISMGIAAPRANTIIVHYLHNQWSPIYFSKFNFNFITFLYKRILYLYRNYFESKIFNSNKKVVTVSKFMQDYITSNYSQPKNLIKTIYSGIDLNKIHPMNIDKKLILRKLKSRYPQLTKIDETRPITLFVGAFERKGLQLVLNKLPKFSQLIVIGRPERSSNIKIERDFFHIEHTSDINQFYNISDNFVFPSLYEPFGLVLVEAYLDGLNIYTLNKRIGANEILQADEYYHIQSSEKFLSNFSEEVLSSEKRMKIAKERKEKLINSLNWDKVGKKYSDFLF